MVTVKCYFCKKLISVSLADVNRYGERICCGKCLSIHENNEDDEWVELEESL